MTASRMLSVVAGVSLIYDLTAGVVLLVATAQLAAWFGSPVPEPVLFAKLNGLFLIAVGLGYAPAVRNPSANRTYMWIFGPLLKGAGALAFVIDHLQHASPATFLLFAVTDGALAIWTFAALLRPATTAAR